jgi:hypothetical protein
MIDEYPKADRPTAAPLKVRSTPRTAQHRRGLLSDKYDPSNKITMMKSQRSRFLCCGVGSIAN